MTYGSCCQTRDGALDDGDAVHCLAVHDLCRAPRDRQERVDRRSCDFPTPAPARRCQETGALSPSSARRVAQEARQIPENRQFANEDSGTEKHLDLGSTWRSQCFLCSRTSPGWRTHRLTSRRCTRVHCAGSKRLRRQTCQHQRAGRNAGSLVVMGREARLVGRRGRHDYVSVLANNGGARATATAPPPGAPCAAIPGQPVDGQEDCAPTTGIVRLVVGMFPN